MSKGSVRFFTLERFPNAMKHRIVGGYAKTALSILMQWSKKNAMYVDLFAGAGRYEDGQPGSPLIVAEEAAKRLAAGKPPYLHCVNVERDPETYAKLVSNTAHIPPAVITNECGDWKAHIAGILARAQAGAMPTLLFLDPFGFKGIELADLVQILQGIGSDAREMILTLNLDGMQRMISAGKADDDRGKPHSYYALPDKVFGTPTWRQFLVDGELPDSALPDVLDLYERQLLSTGGSGFQRIVASIGIPVRLNGPEAYFLVFVTRSNQGLIKMSDTANKSFEDAWLEHERREDAERQQRPQMEFDVVREPGYLERFAQTLPGLAADLEQELIKSPFGMKIERLHFLLAIHKHFGRFRRKHLGYIVRALREEGAIELNPLTRIEDDTFIKWKGRAKASAN
jgi:three-Cys-motif partner protein